MNRLVDCSRFNLFFFFFFHCRLVIGFIILAQTSRFLLDLTGSNPADGTPIILCPIQTPGINQTWKAEPVQ